MMFGLNSKFKGPISDACDHTLKLRIIQNLTGISTRMIIPKNSNFSISQTHRSQTFYFLKLNK